jgi:metal-responsive CopG/Arc/MetJ family transcriptional regulator
MARPKSDKSNLSNITIRLEERYISDLNLYAQAVGKNRSEILRSLVIEALEAIPEHQRQVMSVLAFVTSGRIYYLCNSGYQHTKINLCRVNIVMDLNLCTQ